MKIMVIGGGISGLCSALDLALRGVEVILIEKKKLGSGTTTKCAGMLHSGARYLVRNEKIAEICFKENSVWRKIVPFAIDSSKRGIFVVPSDYSKEYVKIFNERRERLNIEKISREECFREVPNLNNSIEWGYKTDDFIFNPFIVVQAYHEALLKQKVIIYEDTEIHSASLKNGIWHILFNDNDSVPIKVNGIINASGAGTSKVVSILGGKPLNLKYIHGSMAVFEKRFVDQVISVCGDNFAGDVVIPSGPRTLLGSTWHESSHYGEIHMSIEEKEEMHINVSKLIPQMKDFPLFSSFTGVRIHCERENKLTKIRSGSDFSVIEHRDLPNVITLLSGKFVLARVAAKQAVDTLFSKTIKISASQTHEFILQTPAQLINKFLQ